MARLSLQQYETLSQQRGAFDDYIRARACRNLPIPWLQQMSNVHQQVFKSPPVDFRCNSCLGIALTRLHGLLTEYEGEQEKLKQELELKAAEQVENKPGRKGKQWTK